MRTFLDEGKIDFKGDFFKYTGLFTAARPVQERIPLRWAAMKGPRSFQTAGEIADGLHQALSYSREAYDYVVENVKRRRARPVATSTTSTSAPGSSPSWPRTPRRRSNAARILVAFYISSMPPEQLARHGIDAEELAPVVEALGAGDIAAIERFRPELRGEASLAGTPEECVEKIKSDIEPAGRESHDPGALRRRPGRTVLRPGDPQRADDRRGAPPRRRPGDSGLRLIAGRMSG